MMSLLHCTLEGGPAAPGPPSKPRQNPAEDVAPTSPATVCACTGRLRLRVRAAARCYNGLRRIPVGYYVNKYRRFRVGSASCLPGNHVQAWA